LLWRSSSWCAASTLRFGGSLPPTRL